jgi:signal peptidase II
MHKWKFCNTGLYWLWLSGVVFALDRASKYMVEASLTPYLPVSILPGFNLTLSYNKGAAFSFLNSEAGWQVWFFGLIAMAVSLGMLLWLMRLPKKDRWVSIALAFIIGGALGNLWDRIVAGQVTDFIQWYIADYYWPTFNIADSAICIGAVMLFGQAFFSKKSG